MKPPTDHQGRIIVWFSHGAASAIAGRETVQKYANTNRDVILVYCNTSKDEHEDNARFRRECETWIGRRVKVISSRDYETCDEVFEKERYMAGPQGARCTVELKKIPRFQFQECDDVHVFGFTSDKKELKRIERFESSNPELYTEFILRDLAITKQACYRRLMRAGIELPMMYRLGFRNNNCIGCVKSTSPGYWQKIYELFPEKFWLLANRSRDLGVRLVEVHKVRIFLHELAVMLQAGQTFKYKGEDLSCGPECNPSKT